MSVISNTTVLSNFAGVNQLHLLHQLHQRLYIPTAVYDEIRRGLEEGYAFCHTVVNQVYPVKEKGWIHLTSVSGEAELTAFGRPASENSSRRSRVSGYCATAPLVVINR
jgi:predicted nucleic acid-binding protein